MEPIPDFLSKKEKPPLTAETFLNIPDLTTVLNSKKWPVETTPVYNLLTTISTSKILMDLRMNLMNICYLSLLPRTLI